MLYIFLGAPGSGKGTISDSLVKKHGYKHISTGDIFRSIMASGSDLGNKVKGIIDGGNLVDDDTTWEVAKVALEKQDLLNDNVILDGYPRNLVQGEAITNYMEEKGLADKVKVIFFEVRDGILLERLSGRMICRTCGKAYNKFTMKPLVENKCDIDGGELYQREDDKAENVQVRLDTYAKVTEPLIEFYRKQGSLITIDGEQDSGKTTEITLESVN